jgi:hypothetical protein
VNETSSSSRVITVSGGGAPMFSVCADRIAQVIGTSASMVHGLADCVALRSIT